MSTLIAAERRARVPLRDRFGLPDTRGNRPLLGAATIDSLGTGLVLAFVVVYFATTTTLPLAEVGAALTLARLLASPTAVVVGPLIDRFGARRVALAGNAVSAVAYAGFLVVGSRFWEIVPVAWAAQVGAVTYWTSSTGLVALAARPDGRPRWFALLHTLRNAGLAAGGALGAFAVGAGGVTGLRAAVLANAVSYVIAALLLARWRPADASPLRRDAGQRSGRSGGRSTERDAGPDVAAAGYRRVLRDRRYLLLIAVNLTLVLPSLVLSLLLAVFVTQGLHRPAWIAGALLVANGAQVVLTQTWVTGRLARHRSSRVVAWGAALYALAFAVFAMLPGAPGWAVVVGLVVAGGVYNLAETVATPFQEELSVALAPADLRGRYLAVYQLSWTAGQTAAPALFTLLAAHGAALPWLFLVLLCGVSVLLLGRLARAHR
ncbi:MFS transporter [Streptacidiphilus jiangxiensis]|uniref:Predicted arabinose efflux permease, MFS family n=1 Tax=Streptacidiphilus jiangxiensis TaxID=235985 RepID=A0A1H7UPF1_STRJI|nr:MFS transporter [Streptacidiphilus jiangxiensis]SEL98654.1 Predicted arabinose efflux permease, MFS family [Streptacidiphilus jiangxiensis]